MSYIVDEVKRDYLLEYNEKKLRERRKRVYTFMKTPRELEKVSNGFEIARIRSLAKYFLSEVGQRNLQMRSIGHPFHNGLYTGGGGGYSHCGPTGGPIAT